MRRARYATYLIAGGRRATEAEAVIRHQWEHIDAAMEELETQGMERDFAIRLATLIVMVDGLGC